MDFDQKGKQNSSRESLNMKGTRILSLKNKPPAPVDLIPREISLPQDNNKPAKPGRVIPKTAERTWNVPDLVDDYYLDLLDWGSGNVLAIALGTTVYLWNATNDSTSKLVTVDHKNGPVTSVSWAPDGLHIAVGLNNSQVQLWDTASNRKWLHRFEDHKSAVKALARCPFQANLLASGGGTGDRCIKFWKTNTGACLSSIDTGSQVCSLLWNKNERELFSSHGFSQNKLTLWTYPSMLKMVELTGHTSRVLFMSQSPDGCTVASAAAHETLRFWNVFGAPPPEDASKTAPKERVSHVNRIP